MRNIALFGAILSLLGGSFAARAEPPEPKILARWSGGDSATAFNATFEPGFIPIRLLMTPYSDWTQDQKNQASQTYYDGFWEYVQSFTNRGMVEKCLPPPVMESSSAVGRWNNVAPGSYSAAKVAGAFPFAAIATFQYQEPVWDVALRRIATLKYYKVQQLVRNLTSSQIAVNDLVTVVVPYGTVKVGGRTFCALASTPRLTNDTQNSTPVESKKFLLMGHLPAHQARHVQTNEDYMFRVVGTLLYPPQGIPAYGSQPVELADFLAALQN